MGTSVAVVWDLDGTLADTEQAHYTAWSALCRVQGRDLTWEQFKPTFGLGNPDILHMLLGADLDQETIGRLGDQKEALFREETGGVISAMPGARDLALHLSGLGIPQAIGTSAPPENIGFVLRAIGLESLFPVTVSRWQVANGKPFPDIFLRAAADLNVAPNQCVVLEDAPAGVLAAKAGGMRAVALASTWPESALSEADLIVRDLSTLQWPLDRWEAFAKGTWLPEVDK
ncbi:MAG TPA: HAD family phosphatase [Chloroflexota bacterium]|nr:HAD family phosphatase [Chloroflexota bacterium]